MSRTALKDGFIGLLRLAGLLAACRWLNRDRLIILTYHSVVPSRAGLKDYESRNVVDPEAFSWQMRYLAKHYRCLPLGEAVRRLADGTLPRRAAAVTFDDGFRNNLQYALPVLQRWGVPATVFVTTGHIGQGTRLLWTERVGRLLGEAAPQTVTIPAGGARLTLTLGSSMDRESAVALALKRLKALPRAERDRAIDALEEALTPPAGALPEPNADRYAFLTWAEVRELLQQHVTIGSHTVQHPILTSLDDDAREREVADSKSEIERQLGAPCTLFSYPNGTDEDFDERDKANLKRAGYQAAVSQIAGTNDAGTDPFALRRLNIGRGHTRQLFVAQVSGFWPWVRSLTSRPAPRRAGLQAPAAEWANR